MKILSINREHTKSYGDLAFNVENLPSEEIIQSVKYGNLSIYSINGILHIKSPAGLSIEKKHVREILELIERYENEEIAAQKRKADQHADMLETISKTHGLPLD